MGMRSFIALALLFISVSMHSQSGRTGLFDVDAFHRPSGWFIGLGMTRMFPQDAFSQEYGFTSSGTEELLYNVDFTPTGQNGFLITAGHFWLPSYGFIDRIELGLSYRQHLGREDFRATRLEGVSDTLPSSVAGFHQFEQDHVVLDVRITKAVPIKSYLYGFGGLGADINYMIINDFGSSEGALSINRTPSNTSLDADFNAHLGLGYKTSSAGWLELMLETPIQSIQPFDGLQSRLTVFNSKYRPVYATLSYRWLKKRPDRACPTPPKPSKKKKRRGRGSIKDGQIG